MLWAVSCRETVGSCLHIDVLLACTTYLSTIKYNSFPDIGTVIALMCLTANIVHEWSEEKRVSETIGFQILQISVVLNCEICWTNTESHQWLLKKTPAEVLHCI